MHAPTGFRRRQDQAPGFEFDVFPLDREDLTDAKPGYGREADRRDGGRAAGFGRVQRCSQRRKFGWRKHAVAWFLAGPLYAAHGVGVLRSPAPSLKLREEP